MRVDPAFVRAAARVLGVAIVISVVIYSASIPSQADSNRPKFLTSGSCESLPGGVIEVEAAGGTGTQPTGYSTLAAAFTAINNGVHTGSVAIDICGSTTETVTAQLNASGTGSSSYTSISMIPAGGASRTISGNLTGSLITLNGADRVTIDGSNENGNSLILENLSTGNGASTVKFVQGASENTILRTTINGSSTASGTTGPGGTVFFHTDTLSTGNDNNRISDCKIGPTTNGLPAKAVFFLGSSTAPNDGNVIENNEIFDFFSPNLTSSGVLIGAYSNGGTVSGNRFFQTSPRTQTSGGVHSPIQIANTAAGGFTIANNVIGYANAAGTGTYQMTGVNGSRLLPIYISNHGTANASAISGNTVSNIDVSGSLAGTDATSPFAGILVAQGKVDIGGAGGNIIGDPTTAESIKFTSTGSFASVFGIYQSGPAAASVKNNTVAGLRATNNNSQALDVYGIRVTPSASNFAIAITDNSVGSPAAPISNAAPSIDSHTYGIRADAGYANVSGNTVSDISGASGTTATGTSAATIGIWLNSPSATAGNTISGNTIRRISNTKNANVSVYGLLYNGDSLGTHLVEKNLIYSINIPNASAGNASGILTISGTAAYQNNMVAIGTDGGANQASVGINASSGSGTYLHNSVYVGGTASGGNSATYAFLSSTSSANIRNNILFNGRSNSGGTGKHYAIKLSGASIVSDRNVLFANGSGGFVGQYGSTDAATLAAWRTASGKDANSFSADPMFVSEAGSDPDLHIRTNATTPVESAGVDAGVADDIDSESRGSLTPVDIGADAGDFLAIGAGNSAPVFTSTPPATATEDVGYAYTATISDPDGPGAAWSLATSNTCAGASVSSAGVFTFTPDGPVPPASCTLAIRVCDGGSPNQCVEQSAPIWITAVNDTPVAVDDSAATPKDQPLEIEASALTANDIDPDGPSLSVISVSGATNGTVSMSGAAAKTGMASLAMAGGTITFTPTPGYIGPAGFDYTVSDGSLSDVGRVTLSVGGPTAAEVFISGRVVSPAGRGIGRATITISGGDLEVPRVVMTNPFGYYRVEGLTAGESYVLTVSAKNRTFAVPARVISLTEDAAGIEFVSER